MRKRDDNLRGELLRLARAAVEASGPEGLTMRALAAEAGVAPGTVYNYFKDKDDLLLELTAQDWQEALDAMEEAVSGGGFAGQVGRIHAYLRQRLSSAGPLMGSLEGVRPEAQLRMREMQRQLRWDILRRLEADRAVRPDVWTASFTPERLAALVTRQLVALLRERQSDVDFFTEVLGRLLY